jgi:hypothetical protein
MLTRRSADSNHHNAFNVRFYLLRYPGQATELLNKRLIHTVMTSPFVMNPCHPQSPIRRMLGVRVRTSKVSPVRFHPFSLR